MVILGLITAFIIASASFAFPGNNAVLLSAFTSTSSQSPPQVIASNGAQVFNDPNTGVSITHGFTLQDNDVIIALYGMGDDDSGAPIGNGGISGTSAFTTLTYDSTDGGNDRTSAVLRRIVADAGSEPSSYTFTQDNSIVTNEQQAIILIQVRGVNTTTPEDVASQIVVGEDSFVPDAPDITTTSNNTLVMTFKMTSLLSGHWASQTEGAPSGFTFIRQQDAYDATNFNAVILGSASNEAVSSGLQTIGVWTGTPTTPIGVDYITHTIALRPQ